MSQTLSSFHGKEYLIMVALIFSAGRQVFPAKHTLCTFSESPPKALVKTRTGIWVVVIDSCIS